MPYAICAASLHLSISVTLVLCFAGPAELLFAEDLADPAPVEMVVTPYRTETPKEQAPVGLVVITAEQIQKRGLISVSELLRNVASLDVVRSGGPGGNSAAFMRGTNAEHTLVFVDGVEVNNPISTNHSYNFADLTLDNIERIEILPGAQSVLYGSDAIGGVLNIITKTGGKTEASASFEGGSFASFTETASASGAAGLMKVAVAASRQDSDSISSANSHAGNPEKDGYRNTSFSAKGDAELGCLGDLQTSVRYKNAQAEFDDFGGALGDDPNRALKNSELFARAALKSELMDNVWSQEVSLALARHMLDDHDNSDSEHPIDKLRSNYEGEMRGLSLQERVNLSEELVLLTGVDGKQEVGHSNYYSENEFGPYTDNLERSTIETVGGYLQLQAQPLKGFTNTAGVRADHHSKFGDEVTWRFAPVLLFGGGDSKLSAALGTGFKAPSLFQLYSTYGNGELEAERSWGAELGGSHKLTEQLSLGITGFYNQLDNLITFDSATFVFENINSARTRGFELHGEYQLSQRAVFDVNYSYTEAEDRDTNLALLRRPRNKSAATLCYSVTQDLVGSLGGRWIGARYDNDFSTYPAQRKSMSSYFLANIGLSYALSRQLELFGRIENAFDRDYEEVLGYGTPGLAGYAGIRAKL